MGIYKEIQHLQEQMFTTLHACYTALDNKQIDKFKLYVATLEMLNDDYYSITKTHFIEPSRILKLWEQMWEI